MSPHADRCPDDPQYVLDVGGEESVRRAPRAHPDRRRRAHADACRRAPDAIARAPRSRRRRSRGRRVATVLRAPAKRGHARVARDLASRSALLAKPRASRDRSCHAPAHVVVVRDVGRESRRRLRLRARSSVRGSRSLVSSRFLLAHAVSALRTCSRTWVKRSHSTIGQSSEVEQPYDRTMIATLNAVSVSGASKTSR